MTTKRDKDKEEKLTEVDAIVKVKEYRRIAESNIVSILWKDTNLFYTYDNLQLDDFFHNEWRVYFQIGYDLIRVEKKEVLDEITVGLYLEKHLKLKEKYEKYGGYETIVKATEYVKISNLDGYIDDLKKWTTVMDLVKNKFPISDRLSDFVDMSLEDIYDEFEAILNHVFIKAESKDKAYTISYGIHALIDKLDEGFAVGLPYHNCKMLNNETSGSLLGNITLIGGLSGSGKSTFVRNTVIPTLLELNEKCIFMINEEGLAKWQRELMIWVVNNIYKKDIQKYKLRNGKFDKEFKDFLHNEVATWIEKHDENLTILPFSQYNTSKAIKTIKKYAHLGVKYFVLDTFKMDTESEREETFWLNMQNNMVKIYDTIKDSVLNVHIWATFQLKKTSAKQRCYAQDNIGMATGIIDVASTCIMIRNLFEDEFEGGKRELKVFKLEGKNGNTKIPVTLDPKKHYQLLFIVKNREGSSSEYQIVLEHDLSKNTLKEVGITIVPSDF